MSTPARQIEQRKPFRPMTAARLYADGYNDRQRGLRPESEDPHYFRGYSDRIMEEIERANAR